MYDTKTRIEKGRLRELRLVSQHKTHEFEKADGARGGPQVHAKWLPKNRCNMVRSRLGKTQLAVSVKLSVAQSAPPLTVPRLLSTTASPHVEMHTLLRHVPVRQIHERCSSTGMAWTGAVQVAQRWCRIRGSGRSARLELAEQCFGKKKNFHTKALAKNCYKLQLLNRQVLPQEGGVR